MEVLYHVNPYFVRIFPLKYIGLVYGRYLEFRILKWPLILDGWLFQLWAIITVYFEMPKL